jgi:histidine triad (HIT) family protein
MYGCTFCRIINEMSRDRLLYDDEHLVAIACPEPRARVHLLLISRRHIRSVDELADADAPLWSRLILVAQRLARQEGIDVEGEGYQLVANGGRHATRDVPHLHLHLLSGAPCRI